MANTTNNMNIPSQYYTAPPSLQTTLPSSISVLPPPLIPQPSHSGPAPHPARSSTPLETENGIERVQEPIISGDSGVEVPDHSSLYQMHSVKPTKHRLDLQVLSPDDPVLIPSRVPEFHDQQRQLMNYSSDEGKDIDYI